MGKSIRLQYHPQLFTMDIHLDEFLNHIESFNLLFADGFDPNQQLNGILYPPQSYGFISDDITVTLGQYFTDHPDIQSWQISESWDLERSPNPFED